MSQEFDYITDSNNKSDRKSVESDLDTKKRQKRRIRIGIDVGGTFTKAVAIDMLDGKIMGKATTLTTHSSAEGVSEGIICSLHSIIDKCQIKMPEIELISHSTTQAVNALLEGDVSKVGIIGMGVGMEKSSIIKRTNIKHISLDSKSKAEKKIQTFYRFLDTSEYLNRDVVKKTILELIHEGAQVIVISEAYGVDDPSNEDFVEDIVNDIRISKEADISAIAAHDLTSIYGLEIRTLTSIINASILPLATSTARFVEAAVRNDIKASSNVPLKIMKGDGGVTDIQTFETKPILTILSGPAASVAGALLHLHVLNGVFIEVGGTSTNICIIKDGKPKINYVTVMEHPTCIRSLDVRVANVAGGSILRLSDEKKEIIDVGPRSAHIAGLQYSCFADPDEIRQTELEFINYKVESEYADASSHIVLTSRNDKEKKYAITTTCAANALGLIPDGDYSKGNKESARMALSILAQKLNTSMEKAAENILDIASEKVIKILKPMLKEYELVDKQSFHRKDLRIKAGVVMVGGGGAASVLVPYVSKKLSLEYQIAKDAEVISSIGVAASMIYEEIERHVESNPKPEIISQMIDDVRNKAIEKGALPESLSVQSEYISDRSLFRVMASGNVSLDIGTVNAEEITSIRAQKIANQVFGLDDKKELKVDENEASAESIEFNSKNYFILKYEKIKKNLFGKKKSNIRLLVLDKYGRIRVLLKDVYYMINNRENALNGLNDLLNSSKVSKDYDNSPEVYLLDDSRIVDFASLTSVDNLLKAVKYELQKSNSTKILFIIKR